MPLKSQRSSSSVRAANPGAFPSILNLGQALVAELGLGESTDTLGRWMAHYVAELMEAARTALPEDKALAEDRCATAILELWDHRAGRSERRIPMELDPIVAVLNRLDPATPEPMYFASSLREMSKDATNGTMAKDAYAWLRVAEHIDQAARSGIVFALRKAAETEIDRAKYWIKLADEAALDNAPDIKLVRRFIIITTPSETNADAEVEELKHKLASLTDFRQTINTIETEWQAELLRLASSEKSDDLK